MGIGETLGLMILALVVGLVVFVIGGVLIGLVLKLGDLALGLFIRGFWEGVLAIPWIITFLFLMVIGGIILALIGV